MKYVWIVMLVLAYIFWSYKSIKDIRETTRYFARQYVWYALETYTFFWIFSHLAAVFAISLYLFLAK